MSTATLPAAERPFISPAEAARELGIAAEKVCLWIARGELRATNAATNPTGRPRWRIHRSDLAVFLAGRANGTPERRPPRRKRPPQDYVEYIPLD